MTRKDIEDILNKEGIKSEIQEDEHRIRIITEQTVPQTLQELIQEISPAGSKCYFTVRLKTKMPLPKSLQKWYTLVSKEIK